MNGHDNAHKRKKHAKGIDDEILSTVKKMMPRNFIFSGIQTENLNKKL